jgi:hypothetical protein
MVEATSFTAEKVTRHSRLTNEPPKQAHGQAFGLLTQQIAEKVDDKHPQFSKLNVPGLLAIVSDHCGSGIVLEKGAARHVLTSQPYWTGLSTDRMTVDFSNSAFLRQEGDHIIGHNTSISAVLLVAVTVDRTYVCGALHPAPVRTFSGASLWQIPFVYLKDWPIQNGIVRCAGTLGDNAPSFVVPHAPIRCQKQ